MQSNDMLSSLLSDPEKLQSAMKMASSLFGNEDANNSDINLNNPVTEPENFEPPSQPNFNNFASNPTQSSSYDPSADLLAKAMPVITAIAQSGQTAVTPEKSSLLQSIKPFVTTDVGGDLDHALKLVSMARMVRSAMGQLGLKKSNPDN